MKTVKLAIIGTGLIGSHYARICRQMVGVELVALQDASAEQVTLLGAELDVPTYSGSDYTALLGNHPDLDGVLVCTPEAYHLEPALAVLNAGKHLLVEKPLALTSADAERIVEAGQQAKGLAMVAYSLRFDPRYAAMKQAVDHGEIGEVIHLYAQRNPSLDAFYRINGRVELPFWVGVHDIDMLRWITGSEVVRVFASGTKLGMEGAYRAILTNLTFANGAIAVLENGWRATWTSSRQLSVASFQAHGTGGSLELRSSEHGLKITHEGETFSPDTVNMNRVAGEIVGIYRTQIAAFVRCIRENLPSPIPLAEGLAGVRVAEAILQSLREGREIRL